MRCPVHSKWTMFKLQWIKKKKMVDNFEKSKKMSQWMKITSLPLLSLVPEILFLFSKSCASLWSLEKRTQSMKQTFLDPGLLLLGFSVLTKLDLQYQQDWLLACCQPVLCSYTRKEFGQSTLINYRPFWLFTLHCTSDFQLTQN